MVFRFLSEPNLLDIESLLISEDSQPGFQNDFGFSPCDWPAAFENRSQFLWQIQGNRNIEQAVQYFRMKEIIDHGVGNQSEIEIIRDQEAVDLEVNDQAVQSELKMVW